MNTLIKNNGSKCLVFTYTDKNKEVLKKYTERWNKIKNLIKAIDDKQGKYGKDVMKIKFNSEDNLSSNKN